MGTDRDATAGPVGPVRQLRRAAAQFRNTAESGRRVHPETIPPATFGTLLRGFVENMEAAARLADAAATEIERLNSGETDCDGRTDHTPGGAPTRG